MAGSCCFTRLEGQRRDDATRTKITLRKQELCGCLWHDLELQKRDIAVGMLACFLLFFIRQFPGGAPVGGNQLDQRVVLGVCRMHPPDLAFQKHTVDQEKG